MHNNFDDININIPDILNKISTSFYYPPRPLFPKLNLLINAAIYKSRISPEFIYSYLSTSWFTQFKSFWQNILSGRPIDIIDFHALRFNYRIKFQSLSHSNESDPILYSKVWTSPETVYMLFGATWKYAKTSYLNFLPYYIYLPRKGRFLEYGAGIAPFTTGMLKYFPSKNRSHTISDILQINFLYAIYTLPNVKHVIIEPLRNLVDTHYDAIVCETVLEHVSNPFELVKSFYDALPIGGILVFDYIKGDGSGLDSLSSVSQREKTLAFIQTHFKILKGYINPHDNVGLCVAKRLI